MVKPVRGGGEHLDLQMNKVHVMFYVILDTLPFNEGELKTDNKIQESRIQWNVWYKYIVVYTNNVPMKQTINDVNSRPLLNSR